MSCSNSESFRSLTTSSADQTSAATTLVRSTPPTLDGVEEVDEAGYESTPMREDDDPIQQFTTLNDDDNSTAPTPTLVPTLPAKSPPRARALPQPKKRDRADTMSSTTSREGKPEEHKPANPLAVRKSSSESHPPSSVHLLQSRSRMHDRAPAQTQEGRGCRRRRHRFHRLPCKALCCATEQSRRQPLRVLCRNRQRGRFSMLNSSF